MKPKPSLKTTRAEAERCSAQLRRLETEHRDRLRALVRVERRTIMVGGQPVEVDVKVCPTADALGDVSGCQSFAEQVRSPLEGMK
jgi:hypothetical protein